ncbi:uncharacterized protein [Clytia hemisphaerica]|uniref:Uncharacterized protein n=1 Tax=Clytia hemisphaerica TaxID=252671 RepID=A0A7M5X234_9CNID
MNLLVVFVLFISYQCQAFDLPEPPEFANHPDTRISKWSGPYFNDEDQKRVFQSLLHGRSANEGRRRAASDTLGFDPNRLFNPTVERPHRRRKPEGPEAMTFEGNEAEAHPEDGVSPEEKLAHLVSKPIMEYAKDESENRGESRNYPGEPSEERRHRDEGYGERRSEGGEGDDNERRERFEGNEGDRTDAEHFMEEKRRPENFREEEGRRRSERNYRIGAPGRKNLMMKDERQSFFPGLEHGHFYPSKNERFSELYSRSRHQRGENNRKLIEQIRQYIKRSDLPKPYLNKRSKLMKSHSNTIRRSHVRKRSHIKSKGKKSLITGKHQRSHVSKPRLIKLSAKRSKVEKEHNKNKPTKRHSAKRSSVKESALKKRNSTAVHRDEITNHEENQSEVPGQESSNFGNQFSESYRNKDSNNGNNGYSDGEYFGSDSPDTGDDSVAEAMHGANDDTEQLIKSFANDKQFVKSLNGDFTSDGGKDVLLDSERIEGFDSHLLGGEGRHRQGATRQAGGHRQHTVTAEQHHSIATDDAPEVDAALRGHHNPFYGPAPHGTEMSFGYFNPHGISLTHNQRGEATDVYNGHYSNNIMSLDNLPEYKFEQSEAANHIPVSPGDGEGHQLNTSPYFQNFIYPPNETPITNAHRPAATATSLHGVHHQAPRISAHPGTFSTPIHHFDNPPNIGLHTHPAPILGMHSYAAPVVGLPSHGYGTSYQIPVAGFNPHVASPAVLHPAPVHTIQQPRPQLVTFGYGHQYASNVGRPYLSQSTVEQNKVTQAVSQLIGKIAKEAESQKTAQTNLAQAVNTAVQKIVDSKMKPTASNPAPGMAPPLAASGSPPAASGSPPAASGSPPATSSSPPASLGAPPPASGLPPAVPMTQEVIDCDEEEECSRPSVPATTATVAELGANSPGLATSTGGSESSTTSKQESASQVGKVAGQAAASMAQKQGASQAQAGAAATQAAAQTAAKTASANGVSPAQATAAAENAAMGTAGQTAGATSTDVSKATQGAIQTGATTSGNDDSPVQISTAIEASGATTAEEAKAAQSAAATVTETGATTDDAVKAAQTAAQTVKQTGASAGQAAQVGVSTTQAAQEAEEDQQKADQQGGTVTEEGATEGQAQETANAQEAAPAAGAAGAGATGAATEGGAGALDAGGGAGALNAGGDAAGALNAGGGAGILNAGGGAAGALNTGGGAAGALNAEGGAAGALNAGGGAAGVLNTGGGAAGGGASGTLNAGGVAAGALNAGGGAAGALNAGGGAAGTLNAGGGAAGALNAGGGAAGALNAGGGAAGALNAGGGAAGALNAGGGAQPEHSTPEEGQPEHSTPEEGQPEH